MYEEESTDSLPRPRAAKRSLRRLMPFVRPHRKTFLLACGTMSILTASEIVGPIILAYIFDLTVEGGTTLGILLGTGAYLLTFGVTAVTGFAQQLMLTRTGLRIITEIKERVFAHLLSLSTNFHDRNPVGKLIARTESDAEQVKELFSRVAVRLVASAIQFAAILTVMLIWHFQVAVVLLALVPIIAVATWWFMKAIRKLYRRGRRKYAELSGMVTEYVQGTPVVQQYNQTDRALRLLDEKNRAKFVVDNKAWYLDYSFWGAFAFAESLAAAAILWLGADALIDKSLTVGVLIAFLEYTRKVFEPIIVLGEQLNQVQRALASADRVFDLLDTPPDVADAPGALDRVRFEESIALEGVSFSYDGEKRVLDDISFTVRKGEQIALVGPSGGGKTTLVGLLCRFLDPTHGSVRIDGRDLRDYTQRAWRSRVGLVLQEIYMFPGTVLDNLRVLDDTLTAERVARAAESVTADEFIENLADGYGTDLAERGANLSLGERQLLSFARALTADPDLLILDEATSSVDPETEARIQRSLETLLEGRTAVIVAHRLSTVRTVDRILVVKDGRIVEEGPHEELHARGGLYRELYDLQVSGNGRGGRP